LSDLNKT